MNRLIVVRVVLLLLLAGLVVILVSPAVRSNLRAAGNRFSETHLYDRAFDIPEADRRPAQDMSTFYQHQTQFLQSKTLRNRMEFPFQFQSEGSVFTDGYNVILPQDARWQQGMVHRSADILKEREQIASRNARMREAAQ